MCTMEKQRGRRLKPGVPKMPAYSYKPSQAKQLAAVFAKLEQLLITEWPNIKNANLGVKSGTNIVEDIILLQLSQLALQLHTLAVSDAEAGSVLVRLVAKMSQQHFQQLQVLLDVLGHEELSDYLALLVPMATAKQHCSCNKGHSTAEASSAAGSSEILAATQSRSANSTGRQAQLPPDSGGPGNGTWQRRQRAIGLGNPHKDVGVAGYGRSSSSSSRWQMLGSTSLPDFKSLRFASLLPPGHILAKTAEELQREHEFEAALAASDAARAAAAAAAKQANCQSLVSMLSLSANTNVGHPASGGSYGGLSLNHYSRPGSGGTPGSPFKWADDYQALAFSQQGFRSLIHQHNNRAKKTWALGDSATPAESPLAVSNFTAPRRSVEQLWKDGRAAVSQTVLGQAHMEVREQPMSALILEPTYVIQPRVLRPASPPLLQINTEGASAAGGAANSVRPGNSRRGSVTSRPCSARRASKMSGCGFQPAADAGSMMPAAGPVAACGQTTSASLAGSSNSCNAGVFANVAGGLQAQQESVAAVVAAAAASPPRSGNGGSQSPIAGTATGISSPPFTRRAALGPNNLGLNLKQCGLGINLLDGRVAGHSSSTGVPGLQLSRLGSMHAPGVLQTAGARPGSAASTARSRPDSAVTSNISRPTSARGYR